MNDQEKLSYLTTALACDLVEIDAMTRDVAKLLETNPSTALRTDLARVQQNFVNLQALAQAHTADFATLSPGNMVAFQELVHRGYGAYKQQLFGLLQGWGFFQKNKRLFVSDESKQTLEQWARDTGCHMPSLDEKHHLAGKTGLTVSQLTSWFTNAKNRKWNKQPHAEKPTKRVRELMEEEEMPAAAAASSFASAEDLDMERFDWKEVSS
jgi:hypothetical protein